MNHTDLPIPVHFNKDSAGKIWKVDYRQRAEDALLWRKKYNLKASSKDKTRIALLLIDVQNTFCLPEFELFVGGRSGKGAVEDSRRLCTFIYKNLDVITDIIPTMDTHQAVQIFHSIFFVNDEGNHPDPYTLISAEDIKKGKWKVNPEILEVVKMNSKEAGNYLAYYTQELENVSRYNLTVWPYHAMLGGIGHALVPAVEEAIFFHSIARSSQPDYQVKGRNPLTEHYSALGPEVTTNAKGKKITDKNKMLIKKLLNYDTIIIAGEAKSHCVAWTVEDILRSFMLKDKSHISKICLLEDCTSPVVIPGVIDYTEDADKAFKKFMDAGMKIINSEAGL